MASGDADEGRRLRAGGRGPCRRQPPLPVDGRCQRRRAARMRFSDAPAIGPNAPSQVRVYSAPPTSPTPGASRGPFPGRPRREEHRHPEGTAGCGPGRAGGSPERMAAACGRRKPSGTPGKAGVHVVAQAGRAGPAGVVRGPWAASGGRSGEASRVIWGEVAPGVPVNQFTRPSAWCEARPSTIQAKP